MHELKLKTLLIIGTGSFIGGVLRYLLSLFIQNKFPVKFPFGTFSVNLAGCLLIGIVFGLTDKGFTSDEFKLFLSTGILGGFTTFSAFSIESINLMLEGEIVIAIIYIIASVLGGLLAAYAGITLIKLL